jgi:predicted PurR-regulated permease PerM
LQDKLPLVLRTLLSNIFKTFKKMTYNLKNSYLSLCVFLLFVAFFLLSSAILIIRVNNIRQTVTSHVEDINDLSRFESEIFQILSNIENLNDFEIVRASNALISSSEVTIKTVDFSRLKSLLKISNTKLNKVQIESELSMYKKSCQYTIGEHRKQLGASSAKLSDYWNYTHMLLISACVLLIIVSAIMFYTLKSKKTLQNN